MHVRCTPASPRPSPAWNDPDRPATHTFDSPDSHATQDPGEHVPSPVDVPTIATRIRDAYRHHLAYLWDPGFAPHDRWRAARPWLIILACTVAGIIHPINGV